MSGYVQPSSGRLAAELDVAQPSTGPASALTLAFVDSPRWLEASGVVGAFGTAAVANIAQGIFTQGFAGSVGSLSIELKTRYIQPEGLASRENFGLLYIYRDRQVVSPSGIAGGETFGNILQVAISRYRPPAPVNIPFRWVSADAYTPPSVHAIPAEFLNTNVFRQIAPSGVASGLAFGTAFARNQYETVAPTAIAPGSIGQPTFTVGPVTIAPTGIAAGAFGSPTVADARQTINLSTYGISGFAGFGSLRIEFLNRRLAPAGLEATLFGTVNLSGGIRVIDVPGLSSLAIGTAFVAYRQRFVSPSFIFGTAFGTTLVDRHHQVYPSGFDASQFGATVVRDNSQTVYSQPITGAVGVPMVDFAVRSVYPVGFRSLNEAALPSERWGRPEVYNLRQYITQLFEVTPYDGGTFGTFNYVENRNRTVGAIGWRDSRFPLTHLVELAARALLADGVDVAVFGAAMVAYRVRSLPLDGIEPGSVSYWAIVRNAARLVAAAGGVMTQFGVAAVESNRRFLTYAGGEDTAIFGEAFVAYRVRSVAPYYPYQGGLPPDPVVRLGTRYLSPTGIAPAEVGAHTLEIHRTIIAPRWVFSDRFGTEIRVRNLTPEIHPYAYDMAEFGATRIFNRLNYYAIQGYIATLFGLTAVAHRNRTIAVNGLLAFRTNQTTEVRNLAPDPPSMRTISQSEYQLAEDQVPRPTVRPNSIFPESVMPFTLYGHPALVLMGIGPAGGIFLTDQFGRAALNPAQYVDLVGIDAFASDRSRINPHTVWATSETPQQAIDNHPESNPWEPIDTRVFGEGHPERPVFGLPVVDFLNRFIQCRHSASDDDFTVGERFGVTDISNRRRTVQPTGIKAFKYGVPVLNGGHEIDAAGSDHLEMGTPDVSIYVDPTLPRYVLASGRDQFEYGQPVVSNFIRELLPPGLASAVIGLARVHPPEPIIPVGYRADVYGTTWVSHRIRTVEAEGIDPPEIDYTPGSFVDRMRVFERNTIYIPGIPQNAFGTPTVSAKNRTLFVDRVPDEWGVPSPLIRLQNRVMLAGYGWDSSEFGDVDRWEAGKIKPHGDDLAQYGQARIDRSVQSEGFSGETGTPRLVAILRALGIDPSDLGGTTITHGDNSFVCGQSPRAIPVPGTQHITFGQASIA